MKMGFYKWNFCLEKPSSGLIFSKGLVPKKFFNTVKLFLFFLISKCLHCELRYVATISQPNCEKKKEKKIKTLPFFLFILFFLLIPRSTCVYFYFFSVAYRNQVVTYCNVSTFRIKKKGLIIWDKPFWKMGPTCGLF